jgi:hypothetical protein
MNVPPFFDGVGRWKVKGKPKPRFAFPALEKVRADVFRISLGKPAGVMGVATGQSTFGVKSLRFGQRCRLT